MIFAELIQETRWWCPWCGDHMGWMGGWFGGLLAVGVLALLLGLMWTMVRGGQPGERPSEAPSAEEIVRRRYARGEIDEDTFRRMIDELRES